MKRQHEYKEIYGDKGKTRGQKEVEQMMGTREMSNEERKQSKKKQKKRGKARRYPQEHNLNKCPIKNKKGRTENAMASSCNKVEDKAIYRKER